MQSLWRRVAGLALIPWLAVSGLIPPEHVHEADATHPTAVAHRHFEAHDHDDTEVSHGEGRVVWLDSVALEPGRLQLSAALTVLTAIFEGVPATTTRVAVMACAAAPPHPPPRAAASLRAPPAFRLA